MEWGICPIDQGVSIYHTDNMNDTVYVFIVIIMITIVRIGFPLACLLLCGWLGSKIRQGQAI